MSAVLASHSEEETDHTSHLREELAAVSTGRCRDGNGADAVFFVA